MSELGVVQVSVPPHVYNQEQMSRSAELGFVNTSCWPLLEIFPFWWRIKGSECGEKEELCPFPSIPHW